MAAIPTRALSVSGARPIRVGALARVELAGGDVWAGRVSYVSGELVGLKASTTVDGRVRDGETVTLVIGQGESMVAAQARVLSASGSFMRLSRRESSEGLERRRALRVPIAQIVEVTYAASGGTRTCEAEVTDMSASGCAVGTPVPLPVGQAVAIAMRITGTDLQLTGKIVRAWRAEDGVGEHRRCPVRPAPARHDRPHQALLGRAAPGDGESPAGLPEASRRPLLTPSTPSREGRSGWHDSAWVEMSQFDEAIASPEWAFAVAAALEQQLRDDRVITVGSARPTTAEIVSDDAARAVSVRFTAGDGQHGSITLIAGPDFAEALEQAASDEILVTSCGGALDAGVRTVGEQTVTEVETDAAAEIDTELFDDDRDLASVVYPLLDGTDVLGCLVLRVSSGADGADAGPANDHDAAANAGRATESATATPVSADSASYVLADVEMGVTAELGRCRMTVRELLSITPGAVIDLDRAAGAPVDVLVNGTLIARGEVVVIDEEFGIRISELIPQPAAAR